MIALALFKFSRITFATLYNGLSTLVPESGYFVSGNRWLCCQNRQQNRLFPDIKFPFRATKSPVSGYKFAVSDNEVACFRIPSILIREPVWTGLKTFAMWMNNYRALSAAPALSWQCRRGRRRCRLTASSRSGYTCWVQVSETHQRTPSQRSRSAPSSQHAHTHSIIQATPTCL